MEGAPNNLPSSDASCAKSGCLVSLSLFGLLMVATTLCLMVAGEYLIMVNVRPLAAAKQQVIEVPGDRVDPANEGKLVHVAGQVEAREPYRDDEFGLAIPAVWFGRQVEVFWADPEGGMNWRSSQLRREEDSPDYKRPHPPMGLPISKSESAPDIYLGAFKIPGIEKPQEFRGPTEIFSDPPEKESLKLGAGTSVPTYKGLPGQTMDADWIYFGKDPAHPESGDLRAKFEFVKPGYYSVIAGQKGGELSTYVLGKDTSILLIKPGTASAKEGLGADILGLQVGAWLYRLFNGFWLLVSMAMSYWLLKRILGALPVTGQMVRAGGIAFTLLGTAGLFLLALAFPWLWARPLIGLALLTLAFVCFSSLHGLGSRKLRAASEEETLRALGRVDAE